jgi:hypothetical protein
MSGSTVAEIHPWREALSFSAVSTVYDSNAVTRKARKEVRWAEKRECEEKDPRKELRDPN